MSFELDTQGVEARALPFGATLLTLLVPDRNGQIEPSAAQRGNPPVPWFHSRTA